MQNVNMRMHELPGDYKDLQPLAADVAAQVAPVILRWGLQAHHLALRLLLCPPEGIAQVCGILRAGTLCVSCHVVMCQLLLCLGLPFSGYVRRKLSGLVLFCCCRCAGSPQLMRVRS